MMKAMFCKDVSMCYNGLGKNLLRGLLQMAIEKKQEKDLSQTTDYSQYLDRNSGILLYHQVEEFIRQKIKIGEWP